MVVVVVVVIVVVVVVVVVVVEAVSLLVIVSLLTLLSSLLLFYHLLKDPFVVTGPCPNCGVENRVFFGDVFPGLGIIIIFIINVNYYDYYHRY